MSAGPWLWREDARGRAVGWRVWVLIWLAPVLFAVTGAGLIVHSWWQFENSIETQAEVVRVYRWEDTAGVSPLLRYLDENGEPRESTPGVRSPDWDFEIGSTRTIRYFPGRRGDILLPGSHNAIVPAAILSIAFLLTLPALWLHLRVRRWLKEGSRP